MNQVYGQAAKKIIKKSQISIGPRDGSLFKTPVPKQQQQQQQHQLQQLGEEGVVVDSAAAAATTTTTADLVAEMKLCATRILTLFHRNIQESGIDQRVRGDVVLLPFAIPDDIGITPSHLQMYSDLASDAIDEMYASSAASSSEFDNSSSSTTILLARAILHWSVLGPESAAATAATNNSKSSMPLLLSLAEQIAIVTAHFEKILLCSSSSSRNNQHRAAATATAALDLEIARLEWRMVNATMQARQVEMQDMAVDEEARAHVQKMSYVLESHAATVRIALSKLVQFADHRRKHARLVKFIYPKLLRPISNGVGAECSSSSPSTTTTTATVRLETPTNRWLVLDAHVVFRPLH